MSLITRFKQTCAELNPDLDLSLNECDDNAFLDPITEAHWQGYQMANRWFPIETAPKDGTEIIVFGGIYGCEFSPFEFHNAKIKKPVGAYYDSDNKQWQKSTDLHSDCPSYLMPNHWRPLPIPPLTTKGGE